MQEKSFVGGRVGGGEGVLVSGEEQSKGKGGTGQCDRRGEEEGREIRIFAV